MIALGIIGFLSFLICIVLTIISAVKKNGKTKKWGIGIAICFVLFLVGVIINSPAKDNSTKASVSNDVSSTTKQLETNSAAKEVAKATEQPMQQEKPKEVEKPKATINKIGDSIQSGNAIFTVNSVREIKGSELFKPKDGNIYYAVDVTVENKGDKSLIVSSIVMFKLIDSESYSHNITIGPETKGQLDGEVAAGRKLRGELAYELPKDIKGLELEIDPSMWSSGKVIFKLDR